MPILIDKARLQQRVSELAAQISIDYAGLMIDAVCLLNGATMFAADLLRQLTVPVRLHQMGFDSYAGQPQSGEVRITLDVLAPLNGCHILLLEGAVISGRTPKYLANMLALRQPASLKICALGVKRGPRAVNLLIDYVGFELGPEFAMGYGMGKGAERCLADIVEMDGH